MHNIDLETGIHYGVISQNAVLEAWADSSEPDYGPPTCPKCGSENLEGEYYCSDCDYEFEGDEAFGDTENFYLSDGEYQAWSDSYGDIFITKSPYYTFRGFCSPCAPNA
jgi:ribosomal protein L37AE/L43A